jgi:hypothetical protein
MATLSQGLCAGLLESFTAAPFGRKGEDDRLVSLTLANAAGRQVLGPPPPTAADQRRITRRGQDQLSVALLGVGARAR